MRATSRTCLAALWLVAFAGCGGPTFDEQVRAFATPTSSLGSLNPQLPQLIRAVEHQRGLPLQLAGLAQPLGQVSTSDEINTAQALAAIYSPWLHLKLTPTLTTLVAHNAPAQKRDEFLEQHKELVERTTDAADLPRCVFGVEYERGFFASMSYLDDASLATRLMLLRCRQSATKKRRAPALADMLRALRLCHALARERRVEARALAASLRYEALNVATDCFYQGIWRRPEAEQFYELLREQLNDWPDDMLMLIGERATVIHAYEAIRGGMLDRLMTLEEYYRFNGKVEKFEKATPLQIDADEVRYLQTMQRLITVAETPYPSRVTEIAAAMAEVNSEPKLFAATLFTRDLPAAMETAAIDKTNVEAWTLALATAAELHPPPPGLSPHTGKPLEVEQNAERVEIYDGQDMLVGLPLLLK